MSEELNRSFYIDAARLISAILIIVFHALCYHPELMKNASGFLFFTPAIPFFLFFAGYFSRQTTWKSIAKRAFALAVMYFLWESIAVILTSDSYTTALSMPLYFKTYWNGPLLNYPLWFLRILLLCTLCLPFLIYIRRYTIHIAILLLLAGEFKLYPVSIESQVDGFSYFHLQVFAYFALGFGMQFLESRKIESFFKANWPSILIAFLAICTALQLWQPAINTRYENHPLLAISGILFLCSIGMMLQVMLSKMERIIRYLSTCSFLLFTCHVAIFHLNIRFFGSSFFFDNFWFDATFWVFETLIAALIILLIFRRLMPKLLPYIAGVKK